MSDTSLDEDVLVSAAMSGDQEAYGRLVAPHRAELHAHCYRMLGSSADAEDALQEALVRAWRGLRGFEGRGSLRAWLYAIATNACLRVLERRPRRMLPIDFEPATDPHDGVRAPLSESMWIEPYEGARATLVEATGTPEVRYEQRESVELAFIAVLQHLAPRPRAALILHDVLGFPAREIAAMLGSTPSSVFSSLQRARKTLGERLPRPTQQTTLRRLGDAALSGIVERYVDAWQRGDVPAIVAMLTEDAIVSMPPLPTWYSGLEAVREFLATWPLAGQDRWQLVPTRASAQLAFGKYLREDATGTYLPYSLSVLTLRGSRIAAITAFLQPHPFARFELPARLEPRAS